MMESVLRKIPCNDGGNDHDDLFTREWLVTNGLGGYAAGTVGGIPTRRYHGLLISALPAPWGRQMKLLHLSERIRLQGGQTVKLSGEELEAPQGPSGCNPFLQEFRLEMGLPVWRYEAHGVTLEKTVVMPHEQNTVYVIYRLLKGEWVRLKLLPALHNRSHDAPVNTPLPAAFEIRETESNLEFRAGNEIPPLRMQLHGEEQAFTIERKILPEVLYPVEESRGYERQGLMWSPGYFRADLTPDQSVVLVASTESWTTLASLNGPMALAAEHARRERLLAAANPAARLGMAAELVLAADQFIIQPVGRQADAAWVHAQGDQPRTVIAGYHWFTDWGRDTMISLEGLTLCTGRQNEAGYILRTFAHYIRDGLIPNLFPEGENEGLYHTADATLWFFHALDRYLSLTRDELTLTLLLPKLVDVAEHHLRGTRFGIGVDPSDGLLRQGAEGFQLTWMDAKVDDWVVTPRRGKAVEINALWYNALCLLSDWLRQQNQGQQAEKWKQCAERTRTAFNRRFWYEAEGYLYDIVDGEQGDDPACRPNQLFAFSLRYAVLDPRRWQPVLDVVQEKLLTPLGLRSLSPDHPDYHAKYFGDRRARDAAYHQGTVWAWLIGPFIDAWLRVHPADRAGARAFLAGFARHLDEDCVGSISEVFDAESPYHPRGCVAQAWSVAEVLRTWIKTQPEMKNGLTTSELVTENRE